MWYHLQYGISIKPRNAQVGDNPSLTVRESYLV